VQSQCAAYQTQQKRFNWITRAVSCSASLASCFRRLIERDSPRTAQARQTVDSSAFRRAIGTFATGVTVISTGTTREPHCMTANAVASVSLDPPLLLVCVSRDSRMAGYLKHEKRFAVNVLSEQQEPLSRYFSRSWPDSANPPEYRLARTGSTPVLEGSVASLICDIHQRYDGGDHDIILGLVQAIHYSRPDNAPLLFYRGSYDTLASVVDKQELSI
jgi:flavin reductase (DIM6/NTAB) family NADH-FMN oxidoreductase RutF